MKRTNLKKIRTAAEKFFKSRDLTVETELSGKRLDVKGSFTVYDCDDEVTMLITFWDNGTAMFSAVFDRMETSPENLSLLNQFNHETDFLSAYINEDNHYLVLQCTALYVREGDAALWLNRFLAELMDRSYRPYIEVFCGITQP